jgi:ABC-type polysaccharide/polyol phosphate transport system ATPase subunit
MIKRIEVKNISKKFNADFRKSETALSSLVGILSSRNEKRELAVLDDISFEVSAGEIWYYRQNGSALCCV